MKPEAKPHGANQEGRMMDDEAATEAAQSHHKAW
jgi:hypothetical protein